MHSRRAWMGLWMGCCLPALALVVLSGCGSSGGGGNTGGGGSTSTYTIGGTISGLTASGLTLKESVSGQTTSPASGATSFTFPNAVAAGASYAVTVMAQPTGESCTVTNGSGTVAASNVTSVQVSCAATATYTIGGTISGLTASGLTLTESVSGQTVSPAAGATGFVFANAVAAGASYAVTVTAQPVGESCTISGGSGTVATSNVTSIQVACAASGSYTIGGTISGLTTSGLTLKETVSGQTVSPASGATSFVFANGVATGASYSVTVTAQPTGESCSVASGAGTVATSNVTNVMVTCSVTSGQTAVPLVVMPEALPGATAGTAYTATLTASGTGTFSWTGSTLVDGGAMNKYPTNNLTLSSAGVLSGTPFYSGAQPMGISVTRADGASAFVQTELSIGGTGSSQEITNSPLTATQGQSYSWQMATSWGYTGSNLGCTPGALMIFGSIPPGLAFNALNTTNGTLFGTPTLAGTYTMTLMADPGTTLCAPEPTNFRTVTLTVAPAASPTTPAGSSNWTRKTTTAVLGPSSSGWDSYLVGSPSVAMSGSTYLMYYEGVNTTTDAHAIGVATSTDGVNWTKSSAPVVQAASGAWDATEVRYPAVINNNGSFLMIFQGTGTGTALGLATSTDGMHWTQHSGAVFTGAGVVSAYVPGSLLYVSGQYLLFYTADGAVGSMTSPDGVNWTDNGAVFAPNGNGVTFSRPAVTYDGTKYRMWYTRIADANGGTAATSGLYTVTIGYADSADGKTWTTYGNPVLTSGAAGEWDRPGVGDAAVIENGTSFQMWYAGGREQLPGGNADTDAWVEGSIGYAYIP